MARILIDRRDEFRRLFRDVLTALPAGSFGAEWVKSRGAIVPLISGEIFMRLHDRYSEKPGTVELVPGDGFAAVIQLRAVTETYPGGEVRTLLPLTRLVLELVAWAREAPEIKPGRK